MIESVCNETQVALKHKLRENKICDYKVNPTFVFMGTFINLIGWIFFNGGSTLSMQTARSVGASKIVMNTFLSTCASAMVVSFVRPHVMREYSRLNLFDVTHMSNGIFAGLVGITSACDSVEPWAAFVIGLMSGSFYIFGSWLLQKLKIDDPSDSLPSSFFCAIWGVLSAGIFEELEEINY